MREYLGIVEAKRGGYCGIKFNVHGNYAELGSFLIKVAI